MSKFAKLFDVEGNHQVLATLRTDADEQYIEQTTLYDDVYITVKLGFKQEDTAEQAFKDYNEENAARFFQTCVDMFAA